jgi:ketosteroid isomerase-like protein
MTSFRDAVEQQDLDGVEALLADDVVFRSPVAHTPYSGKAITSAILRHVFEVFEDFRYVRDLRDEATGDHVLVFEATVGGLEVTGADFLQYDADGRIVDLMVMVRPLKGAQALAEQMGARFDRVKTDAGAIAARLARV